MVDHRIRYLAAAAILFAVETAIALFAAGGFIRHTFGDFLVVILLYCALRGVAAAAAFPAAATAFAFACLVEAGQAAGLFNGLSSPVARIALGATFSWADIAAYAAGAAAALAADPAGPLRNRFNS